MTEERKQQIIKNVNGTMSIEGMPLTAEDKQRIADVFDKKITGDEAIRQIIEKHKQ